MSQQDNEQKQPLSSEDVISETTIESQQLQEAPQTIDKQQEREKDEREKEKEEAEKEEEREKEEETGKRKKGKKKQELLTITARELRVMSKKIEQLDLVKEEYEKMRKNYELLRADRDQFKTACEQSLARQQNLKQSLQQTESRGEISLKNAEKQYKDLQSKKNEECRRLQGNKEVLQEKIRQLERIVDMTTTNLQTTKKGVERLQAQIEKHRQLLRLQRQSNSASKIELQRLRLVESETFVLKQELVRISGQYKALKAEKEQLPIMMDKFEHQQTIIQQLKDTIQEIQTRNRETKTLSDKLEKKVAGLLEEKKELQKKAARAKLQAEQAMGEADALKMQLQEERQEWEVQKKRYATDIRGLRTQLHREHQKLTITEWELNQSRKREKQPVQVERVDVHSLSKESLLNLLQEMEMKNQSMKLTIDHTANILHEKELRIKQQEAAIVTLTRELTKDYPDLHESEGMPYVEPDILEMGKAKREDWGQIVQKVMIENLRLKYSVTALGEEYNQKLRKELEKLEK